MSTADLTSGVGDLWAITAYFNPMGYTRRRANYRMFRQHLGVPLVTVELAYGRQFELGEGDADILVQRCGHDIMWQKERLLNVGLQHLPPACRKVVWLDCDVVFESEDWAERTRGLLDRFVLVQPFSHVHRMPRNWQPGDGLVPNAEMRRSIPYLIASGMAEATCLSSPAEVVGSSPGYAWAADRALLEKHGFYDACIAGGADSASVRAAYGYFDDAVRLQFMNTRQREHFLHWASPYYAAVRGNVASVAGNLFHIWHGHAENRAYRARFEQFSRFQFDPSDDIAIEESGAWRWNSDKCDMHEHLRNYFASRKEDG